MGRLEAQTKQPELPDFKGRSTNREYSLKRIAHRSEQFISQLPFDQVSSQIAAWEKLYRGKSDNERRLAQQQVLELILQGKNIPSDTPETPQTPPITEQKRLQSIREGKAKPTSLAEIRIAGEAGQLTKADLLTYAPIILGSVGAAAEILYDYPSIYDRQIKTALVAVAGNDKEHMKGTIAELETGGGKTLSAAMSAITYALESPDTAVFVATTNDYLAKRDANEMGKLYQALGMTLSYIAPGGKEQYEYRPDYIDPEDPNNHLMPVNSRQSAYECDVVYGSTQEFAFDYIRDTIEVNPAEIRQVKGRNVIIQDEADQVLLDDAVTSLLLEGPKLGMDQEMSPALKRGETTYSPEELHEKFAQIILMLDESDITVNLTDRTAYFAEPSHAIPKNDLTPDERERYVAQVEEKLKGVGLTLRDFYDEQEPEEGPHPRVEHLIQGLRTTGAYRAAEFMKAFGLMNDKGVTADGKKFTLSHHFQSKDASILQYYVNAALQARMLHTENVEYAKSTEHEGEFDVLEYFSGRVLSGRRIGQGVHEAIEAQHRVWDLAEFGHSDIKIQAESKVFADITYEEFFSLFNRVAGFTGTASSRAEEFANAYKLDVVQIPIPPDERSKRTDHPENVLYRSQLQKFRGILDNEILPLYSKPHTDAQGDQFVRPILITFQTAQEVEAFYEFLKLQQDLRNDVLPEFLNSATIEFLTASNRDRAEDILDNAGRKNHITITNMAGRGVDSQLGGKRPQPDEFATADEFYKALTAYQRKEQEIQDAFTNIEAGGNRKTTPKDVWEKDHADLTSETVGGMLIIGEHGSIEADLQLMGRAGRNGDYGETKFYSAFDDFLMTFAYGEEWKQEFIIYKSDEKGVVVRDSRDNKNLASFYIENAQDALYLRDEQRRTSLREQHFPLRKARELYLAEREKRFTAAPETALPTLTTWIQNAIDIMATRYTYSQDYGTNKAAERLYSQITYLLSDTDEGEEAVDRRHELHSVILKTINPDNPHDKPTMRNTLKNYVQEHMDQTIRQCHKEYEEVLPTLPQFQGKTFPPSVLENAATSAVSIHMHHLLLNAMTLGWQDFTEQATANNKHLLAFSAERAKGPQALLAELQNATADRYGQFQQDAQIEAARLLFRLPTELKTSLHPEEN